MSLTTFVSRLKDAGFRDTQPRRMVMDVVARSSTPLSVQDILKKITARGDVVNLVTVYRVLELLESFHIVHKHPCDGSYSLCSLPDVEGHHGFMHCSSCGKSEEFISEDLCKVENFIAKSSKFQPSHHVSEIIGHCRLCAS